MVIGAYALGFLQVYVCTWIQFKCTIEVQMVPRFAYVDRGANRHVGNRGANRHVGNRGANRHVFRDPHICEKYRIYRMNGLHVFLLSEKTLAVHTSVVFRKGI
jgi:hypothetical protein